MTDWIKGLLAKKVGIYVILAAFLAVGVIGGVIGRYTAAVTVANQKTATAVAKTETANCHTARATDTANENGATAKSLNASAGRSAKADDKSNTTNETRATGYARAQEDANHATPQPKPIYLDAHPLRVLFDGVRDADRTAAGATEQDRGGGPQAP